FVTSSRHRTPAVTSSCNEPPGTALTTSVPLRLPPTAARKLTSTAQEARGASGAWQSFWRMAISGVPLTTIIGAPVTKSPALVIVQRKVDGGGPSMFSTPKSIAVAPDSVGGASGACAV